LDLTKIKNILVKAQRFSALWEDNNFQEWKKKIVDSRLENYKNAVLTTDPDSEAHKRALISYQELKFICEDIFKWQKAAEDKAKKELKNLGE
jgi:hypothetical protein